MKKFLKKCLLSVCIAMMPPPKIRMKLVPSLISGAVHEQNAISRQNMLFQSQTVSPTILYRLMGDNGGICRMKKRPQIAGLLSAAFSVREMLLFQAG